MPKSSSKKCFLATVCIVDIHPAGSQIGGIYSPIEFFEEIILFDEDTESYASDLKESIDLIESQILIKADKVQADAVVGFSIKTERVASSQLKIRVMATAIKYA